jgi:hypothetical protein
MLLTTTQTPVRANEGKSRVVQLTALWRKAAVASTNDFGGHLDVLLQHPIAFS